MAARLMRGSDLKLDDIAERAGYGSQAAFSRAFHRYVGVPPTQWRERAKRLLPKPGAVWLDKDADS